MPFYKTLPKKQSLEISHTETIPVHLRPPEIDIFYRLGAPAGSPVR
jgi:hypothetical protein